LEIKVLGCSGAKSVGKSPTSFLIDKQLLIDCGAVVSKLGSKFILDNLECVLLTHSHFDHIMELPFLLELLLQGRKQPFKVYASADSIRSLYSNIFNYECWPNLFEIAEKENVDIKLAEFANLKQFRIDEYKITPVLVNHTIPTHGFIIDNGVKSFGFTGDTYVTDSFWENCNKKDNLKAVIVDVSYPGHMSDAAEITKHMTTDNLIQELNKLNSKDVKILLSHMKPQLAEEIKAEISGIQSDFNITILEDGMTVNI